jgi:hypothetical protein
MHDSQIVFQPHASLWGLPLTPLDTAIRRCHRCDEGLSIGMTQVAELSHRPGALGAVWLLLDGDPDAHRPVSMMVRV